MIPILYSKTETTFTHNGLGLLTDISSAKVTEERNGVYELTFQYPISGQRYSAIEDGCIVKAKPNDTSSLQLFKIYKSSKPINGIVTFYAEHISYALNGLPLAGYRIASATARGAIRRALQDTPLTHSFTAESDITTLNSTTIKAPCSVRGLLGGQEGSILDVWGGEYEFDNFNIILHAHRGTDNGVTIEYGKNLTDIKQESNISECYTHLMPYAVYNQDDGNGNSNEVYVYLTERVIALPTAANLGHEKALIMDFSDYFGDNEVPTEAKLRIKANSYIASADLTTPKVNITVSFIQLWQTEEYKNIAPLERVNLCDTVGVYFSKLGVSASAKVIKTVYDVLKEKYESVTIGDAKSNFADTVNKQSADITRITALIKSGVSQATAELNKAIQRATDAITGQSGGYVVLNPATNPQEILIMDSPSIETAQNVWRWNSGGLGFSSTGYNGTYGTAITMNGDIVADFIAAGTLNGALLLAGSVEANALSVSYKNSVQSDINSAANTVRQEFAVADNQVLSTINTTLQSYSTTTEMNSAITQSAQSITSQVSQTLTSYSTTQQMNDAIDDSIDDALQDYSTTTEMNSAISQTASSITTQVNQKVGYTELGTKIEQNANSVRIAWNNNSDYIKLESGQLNIYDATNKLISFNSEGQDIYYKGSFVGNIGSGYWNDDDSKRGIAFHLANASAFMSWGWKTSSSATSYTVKWLYAASSLPYSSGPGSFTADNLHAGCDVDMHNYNLKKVVLKDWGFDGGAISGTFSGIYLTAVHNDGSFDYRTFSLTFNRGILKSASW